MNSIVIRPVRVRTAGIRQKHMILAQQRLMILMLLFGAAMLLIAVRLLFVGLFDGPSGRSAATAGDTVESPAATFAAWLPGTA